MTHLMNTYSRLPVAFTRGRGAWLTDEQGREYLDALAGIAVNGLGHAHPRLVAALTEQIGRLIHTSNVYRVREQEELADRLCALSGLQEVFFGNSGSEANEGALKLVRLYGHKHGEPEAQTLVMERAWHGRTLATLAATGSEKARKGFDPLPSGFIRIPYNDIEAVERAAAADPRVRAVWIEVLQGEGGIQVADLDYVRALRRTCDERGWLLMIDEVQSGIGRTGKWFAHQWAGIKPDVMTLAKGLGSGVPIGALLAGGRAAGVFGPGQHGTTFGGGPLAMRAGLETLAIIESEGLMANAFEQGERVRAGLKRELAGVAGVVEIRGMGLMIGVELDRAVRRAGQAGARRRAADQRHERHRDPPAAAARPVGSGGRADRRAPGAGDPRLPRAGRAGRLKTWARRSAISCSSPTSRAPSSSGSSSARE